MKSKMRWFGAAVLLFNLWLIGRYNVSGVPVVLMTFGFAVAYELVVVRSISNSPAASQLVEPSSPGSINKERNITQPAPEPERTLEELANEFGVTLDGQKYRYKGYLYDRLSDAVAYAKIDKTPRSITCK